MPNNAYNLIVFRIAFEMLYLVYSFNVEKQTNKNCKIARTMDIMVTSLKLYFLLGNP